LRGGQLAFCRQNSPAHWKVQHGDRVARLLGFTGASSNFLKRNGRVMNPINSSSTFNGFVRIITGSRALRRIGSKFAIRVVELGHLVGRLPGPTTVCLRPVENAKGPCSRRALMSSTTVMLQSSDSSWYSRCRKALGTTRRRHLSGLTTGRQKRRPPQRPHLIVAIFKRRGLLCYRKQGKLCVFKALIGYLGGYCTQQSDPLPNRAKALGKSSTRNARPRKKIFVDRNHDVIVRRKEIWDAEKLQELCIIRHSIALSSRNHQLCKARRARLGSAFDLYLLLPRQTYLPHSYLKGGSRKHQQHRGLSRCSFFQQTQGLAGKSGQSAYAVGGPGFSV